MSLSLMKWVQQVATPRRSSKNANVSYFLGVPQWFETILLSSETSIGGALWIAWSAAHVDFIPQWSQTHTLLLGSKTSIFGTLRIDWSAARVDFCKL